MTIQIAFILLKYDLKTCLIHYQVHEPIHDDNEMIHKISLC